MLKFAAFCVLCLELHDSSFHFIVSIDFIIFSIKHSICSRKKSSKYLFNLLLFHDLRFGTPPPGFYASYRLFQRLHINRF